jgi:hypothetical protein
MGTSLSIHPNYLGRTLRLRAHSHDLDCAPLIVEARDDNGTVAEVTFYTYSAAVTAALVEAINNAEIGRAAVVPDVPLYIETAEEVF